MSWGDVREEVAPPQSGSGREISSSNELENDDIDSFGRIKRKSEDLDDSHHHNQEEVHNDSYRANQQKKSTIMTNLEEAALEERNAITMQSKLRKSRWDIVPEQVGEEEVGDLTRPQELINPELLSRKCGGWKTKK